MHSRSAAIEGGLYEALVRRGMSRRTFMKFSAAMAAALALPATYGPRIAEAVSSAPRLPIVWLTGQACGGDTAAFLQAAKPTVSELLLDLLTVDYHTALMTASGPAAEQVRTDLRRTFPGGYLAVVEGSIPTVDGGIHATIGGRTLRDIANEVCSGALGTIAVGSCAFDGGASAAAGGRTGAGGVLATVSAPNGIALPGCPVNVENLAATIVHFLTFKEFPVADGRGRPLFAYGGLIHNQCERRAHFEFGEFVLAWGDEGAQKGWCLYKIGCKGPETFANCPTVRYAEKVSWSVKAGHPCIGCTMPAFWDSMGTAYRRLPSPVPSMPGVTADQAGQLLVGGVGAMTVVHGAASFVRAKRNGAAERRKAKAARAAEGAIEATPPATPAVALEPLPASEVSPDAAPVTTAVATTEAEPEGPVPTDRSAVAGADAALLEDTVTSEPSDGLVPPSPPTDPGAER